ncbi:MAG: bifunctional folylpolyglutamate synthase/dihydrofolate synthase [Anaerolineales bacterium]|nr:bifunctional folylpolyglutamate synthase/dihydrofolate synthase [Anaerolineales bacterium]
MSELDNRYQETLDYIYSFVDYSIQHMSSYQPGQYNLTRMWQFIEALDNPQKRYPIIHVAGTKGKGSVSALCASALQAAGYRAGFYSSPHLDDYAERIQINGHLIPHADLVELVAEIKPKIEDIKYLTTFEITTALAFLYFARQNVDVAVIEVGLGGRLDATNVVQPVVSVITSLSYDHQYVLGNTLTEIAGEKAGIIKQGVPVVSAPQMEEARLVIEKVAQEQNAPLALVGRDYLFAPVSHSLDNQSLVVWSPPEQGVFVASVTPDDVEEGDHARLTIPLLGYHQGVNAAVAYATLQVVRHQGLQVSEAAIREGFAHVSWPGRFEILSRQPPVVVDCAHNRDSALRLRQALDDYFPVLPVVMVFGASEDKDVQGMFKELMPRVESVIAAKSFHPRAMEPQILVDLAHQFGKPAILVRDVADALDEAIRQAGSEALVLATGSIFVASGVRIAWSKRGVTK